jgi:hypothetical protein
MTIDLNKTKVFCDGVMRRDWALRDPSRKHEPRELTQKEIKGDYCLECHSYCVYHAGVKYEDLGRKSHNGNTLKECPKCVEEVKTHGGGLSVSEQASMYDDYRRGL